MALATNYGTKLGSGPTGGPYVDIANIKDMKPPKVESSTVDATTHSSGGKQEKVASGLVTIGEMSLTITWLGDETVFTADAVGDTIYCQITFTNGKKWTFGTKGCTITGFEPGEADAQSPDVQTAEITLDPNELPVVS